MIVWKLHGFCVITLIVISIINLCTAASSPKSYGSPCSKRKECNSTAGLTCLKNICQCSNPEILTYSESLETCMIKVGRRCGNEDELEDNTTLKPVNKNNTGNCIENAECRKLKLRKWCRCKEGFMSNREGTQCSTIARYGEVCNDDTELCEKRSGTVCKEGRCECQFGDNQYFDEKERKCISYANGNCSVPKISPCVKHAECVNAQLQTGYTTDLGVNQIHIQSVTQCICTNGYSYNSEDKSCMASSGTECSAKQPCNSQDYLSCVDGKCKCRNPLHEIIDKNTGKCVSLVGSSCGVNATMVNGGCVENSECHEPTGQCQCKNGYSASSKKTCLLSYKQSCEAHQCNIHQGLACINSVCECFDSHLVYEESAKACVGLSSSSD